MPLEYLQATEIKVRSSAAKMKLDVEINYGETYDRGVAGVKESNERGQRGSIAQAAAQTGQNEVTEPSVSRKIHEVRGERSNMKNAPAYNFISLVT